ARGATSEIFAEEGGRAPGSPVALAKFEGVHREGGTLVVRAKDVEWRWSAAPGFTRTARLPEPSRPCAEPRFHAGAERFVVEVANLETYEEGRLCDRWTGARSGVFKIPLSSARSTIVSGDGKLVGIGLDRATIFHADTNLVETLPTGTAPRHFPRKDRLVTRLSSLAQVEVWDIPHARKIGELELEYGYPEVYALSPDDRLLLYQRDVWDLNSGRKLVRLKDTVDAAEFWDDTTLAVVSGVRLTLYRVPSFEPVLGFVAAREAAAAIAFELGAKSASGAGALESFGDASSLDGTLRCSVGNAGVPFRLCREFSETTRVVGAVLAR
ncbi:MAG TPA: hypothetical protein VGK73_26920, partial [Polyangiaceae bacterium]